MVRDALRRGGPHALDAVNSPPVYCYGPHSDDVRSLLRLMFAQSPLHVCGHPDQIPDAPNPIFIYSRFKPVPEDFWAHLARLKALYVCIDTEGRPE